MSELQDLTALIRANTALIDGGGVHVTASLADLVACTVTGNSAPFGGGVRVDPPVATSTVTILATEVCANTLWNIVGPYTEVGSVSSVCDCRGDIDGNGLINALDIAALLTVWGTDGDSYPRTDGNHDGIVNAQDLAILLDAWGVCRQ